MKATAHKIDNSSVTVDAERLLLAGANYDTVLAFLRDHGFGKLDSIKFLCNAAKMTLSDAKQLVHDSAAWKDTFKRDERLHDSLMRALADLGPIQSSSGSGR